MERGERRARTSPAFAVAAHMALGTALDERKLRAAVRTGTDEILLEAAGAQRGLPFGAGHDFPHRHLRGRPRPAEQVLLHALFLLHPALDRDPDGIRNGEDLVGSQ